MALRGGGGGGVINKLLSLVGRALAIAQLTRLHIFVPASGSPPGAVPEDCFPSVPLPRVSEDFFRQHDYSSGCCHGLGAVAGSGTSGPSGDSDS